MWIARFVLAVFIIVPLIVVGIGFKGVFEQRRKIRTYEPVDAVVLSKRIASQTTRSKSGTRTSYWPVVRYRFTVNGMQHTAEEVLPTSEKGSNDWATGLANRFIVNSRYTAYHDPANPDDAFLVRHYSFTPYVMCLVPLLFSGAAGAIYLFGGFASSRVPAPSLRSDRWFELRPRSSIQGKLKKWACFAGLWVVYGLFTIGHYAMVADRPYETQAVVLSSIYGGVGVALVCMVAYYFMLRRNAADARLLIDTMRLAVGGRFTVRVEQPILWPLVVHELKVGLICTAVTRTRSGGKTRISFQKVYEAWASIVDEQSVNAGHVLTGSHEFSIAAGQATSAPGQKDYPRYGWKLKVVTRLAGSPDYNAEFAIFVVDQSQAEPAAGSRYV